MFPPHQQNQIRLSLSAVLKGSISQRLVARADGKGMIPAVEVLVMNARIRELMEDPKRTREIRDAVAGGRNPYGMMTFDQCLTELVLRRYITYETAIAATTTPDDFALYFRGIAKNSEVSAEMRADNNAPGAAAPPPTPAPSARQASHGGPAEEAPLELDRPIGRR